MVEAPITAGPGQVTFGELQTNEEKHFEVYERERIKVDETKWLPFLRKNRWFDWIEVESDFAVEAGRTWSVDDPKVWEVVAIILELVNRILEALIRDKHEGLQTMLYGRMDYWEKEMDILGPEPEPDSAIILSLPFEQEISRSRGVHPCPWDWILDTTSAQWRERLIKLMTTVGWSFRTVYPAEAVAYTIDLEETRHTTMICISVQKVLDIMEADRTLGELCMMKVDIALTIVHEIMHAIGQARYRNDPDYDGNRLDLARSGIFCREPFLDGDGIAELGNNMDTHFFGGSKQLVPLAPQGVNAPPLSFVITEFPYASYTRIPHVPGSAFAEIGAMTVNHFVESTWVSKMLSESFWQDDSYPNKSENYFHRNFLFISQSPNKGGGPVGFEVAEVQDLTQMPFDYPDDAVVVREWHERNAMWNNFRDPWWPRYHFDWTWSPWGDRFSRRKLQWFADGFVQRDSVKCTSVARNVVTALPWKDQDLYFKMLPRMGAEEQPQWAYHCIGLLMLASIPLQQRQPVIGRYQQPGSWATEHTPSMEAAAVSHQDQTVYLWSTFGNVDDKPTEAGRTRLYDVLGTGREIVDFTQFDYLALFDRLLQHMAMVRVVVHSGFLNALRSAKHNILKERQDLQKKYPGRGHTTKWLSRWHFEVPEYSPQLSSFSDGSWVEVYIEGRNL
ncbi:hypothetical protein GGR51DRAFT_520390 [Nemania sp. FL0031]|nr:hypothetical protein GGR51DRAFT_520390 [Nemania sp. FL0031]